MSWQFFSAESIDDLPSAVEFGELLGHDRIRHGQVSRRRLPPEREVTVADVYVRADGGRLAALAEEVAKGLLSLQVGATLSLAEAATALQGAVAGRAGGATVLTSPQEHKPADIGRTSARP